MNEFDPQLDSIRVCAAFSSNVSGDLLSYAFLGRRDIRIVSVSTTVEAALSELAKTPCSILLTNLHLNHERYSGLVLLSQAVSAYPGLRGIVLTESICRNDVVRSFQAGARGYVVEGVTNVSVLVKAIYCVHKGQVWASSEHLNQILDAFASQLNLTQKSQIDPAQARGSLNSLFSGRQGEVVDLMMSGKSNKEIGTILRVSEHTVKNHLVAIFAKLGVTNRTGAIFQIYERFTDCKAPSSSAVPSSQDGLVSPTVLF